MRFSIRNETAVTVFVIVTLNRCIKLETELNPACSEIPFDATQIVGLTPDLWNLKGLTWLSSDPGLWVPNPAGRWPSEPTAGCVGCAVPGHRSRLGTESPRSSPAVRQVELEEDDSDPHRGYRHVGLRSVAFKPKRDLDQNPAALKTKIIFIQNPTFAVKHGDGSITLSISLDCFPD